MYNNVNLWNFRRDIKIIEEKNLAFWDGIVSYLCIKLELILEIQKFREILLLWTGHPRQIFKPPRMSDLCLRAHLDRCFSTWA